ncbi:MAG: hypothetical protein JRH10_09130 [Deltaproteobacteria bacterium]|nr:hypothetical protein [Deltaproteobacteria bacterium]MBW2446844.1 hypothetical protein [Deltaproteobacteria bacterium]
MSDHEFDTAALHDRLSGLGRKLAEREAGEADGLDQARRNVEALRSVVAEGVKGFNEAVVAAGAGQLAVEVSEPRADDKHLRSIQFDLKRGRYAAIVTVKSRGEVTLVGPFRAGKNEGPCLSFPFGAEAELEKALGDFLEQFLEEAATP